MAQHAFRDLLLRRSSQSRVTDEAPDHAELLDAVRAASRIADHGLLRPYRVIELRGGDRERLGRALAKAAGDSGRSDKPLRAPLLLAVVVSRRKSSKPAWEQEATAAGFAHALTWLLEEAGWGVIWRTGDLTRTKPVRKLHELGKREDLLGWLYVGGVIDPAKQRPKKPAHPGDLLQRLP